MSTTFPQHTAPHIAADGETFRPDPRAPLRFEVVIDNENAAGKWREEWPYTMSAYLTEPGGAAIPAATPLLLGVGGVTIGASIPQMLRDLAALIESGEVYA